VDALAHQFKTPPAAIPTAAAGIRETRALPQQIEMAEMIEVETVRLSRLVTRLLATARLDRREVQPRLAPTNLRDLIARIADQYPAETHSLSLDLDEVPVEAASDEELLTLALTQLLDNASKYAAHRSVVAIKLIEAIHQQPFDLVLLDINMPGMGGIEACRRIRPLAPHAGIVMITVCDSLEEKVKALDAGADDYVTKPFLFRELLARLRADAASWIGTTARSRCFSRRRPGTGHQTARIAEKRPGNSPLRNRVRPACVFDAALRRSDRTLEALAIVLGTRVRRRTRISTLLCKASA